jgi:hypothetical protein
MLTLDASRFVQVVEWVNRNRELLKKLKGPISEEDVEFLTEGINETIEHLNGLDLSVSAAAARHVLDASEYPEVHRRLVQLSDTLGFELEQRKFYRPIRQFEKYYDQSKLFGDEVFTAFPSANNDISEAGSCLALERGTACVLHLMRVVEVGLRALATSLGVGHQNDWGSYLREIDTALQTKIKAGGKRSADEQFYAEARVTIDGVRMAWRNPTMHIESSYSPERAEDILSSVRTLMRHLAAKLSETQ